MIFIDGGYLRELAKKYIGTDLLDYTKFSEYCRDVASRGLISAELRRTYYYDANVDAVVDVTKHKALDSYFQRLRTLDFFEVKLGRLIKTEDGYRQKGVDVLLTLDMIRKAYEDQYDAAILVAGDDDYTDLVRAVKDIGKKAYGVLDMASASRRLLESLDKRFDLGDRTLEQFRGEHSTTSS